jgi:acyl-coenzyme A thioesterase 9
LYLSATVTYTDPPLVPADAERYNHPHANPHAPSVEQLKGRTRIQVRVDSKVRNVEHGETKPTGQFNYTFMVDKEVGVMPRTYTEFMMYIDARRRTKRVASLMVGMERLVEEGMTE